MRYTQKTIILESGERYVLLVDKDTGIPLYYPNLYITTQIRNRSLSLSAMSSALNGISILLEYLHTHYGKTPEKRFRVKDFLKIHELDAIRDFCQINHQKTKFNSNTKLVKLKDEKVSSATEYIRLTEIARYVRWLADQIIDKTKDSTLTQQIIKMEKGLKSRRPPKKYRNIETINKGLDSDQIELLLELTTPNSDYNPFLDVSVQKRNRVVILLLIYLGMRGGELLNLRIRDFDFSNNQVLIARRADEKDDPRKQQPLVKTLDRRLPIKNTLASEIHQYIINERRLIPNSNLHDYLIITHKSGPTQGQAITIAGYRKIFEQIRSKYPMLQNFTGHSLRHSWNESFSDKMDTMDTSFSEEKQEKIRSYLMGWREGSGTAATYNKRFIKRKANEASQKLQDGMIRLPKDLSDE